MKILTVSHFYEAHGGGIERVAAELCRQFARDGHEAVWAASDFDSPPLDAADAVPLHCADPVERRIGLPMPIPGLHAIRDLARAIGTSDAVVVHDALYLTSIVAMIAAKLRRKPVVLIQHIASIDFADPVMRNLMRIANRLITRPMMYAADHLIFISDQVRRELLGDPADRKFLLLFNGVNGTIFHSGNPSNRNAIRQKHQIAFDARVALFVGRFVAKKGMSILEQLAHRRPDLHFAFVGSGPLHPEEWNLPNVHALGPQSQQNLANLYAASDLLLLPSVGEGYPLVIQEALACGLPVICGDPSARADPAAAKWLRGVRIDLSDPDGSASRCCAAIDRLLDDPPNSQEMADYAAKTYSWPAMARAIVQSASRPAERVDLAARCHQPG